MPHTNFCSNPPKGSEKEAVFFFFFFSNFSVYGHDGHLGYVT